MLMFALVFGCAGAACDPARESVRSAAQPVVAEVQDASAARPSRLKTAPRRGRLIGGERVSRVPQWPPDAQIDREVLGRAPTALITAVSRSPVPVLVPGCARPR